MQQPIGFFSPGIFAEATYQYIAIPVRGVKPPRHTLRWQKDGGIPRVAISASRKITIDPRLRNKPEFSNKVLKRVAKLAEKEG